MRAAQLVATLFLCAVVATPALAAKTKPIHHAPGAPTWARCYQISLDRGMDHEYDEWRQFLDDCVAGKIPLDAPPVTR